MRSSLKIGSVLGIPIRLHITFLLILPLIAFSFAEGPTRPIPLGFSAISDPLLRYSLGTFVAILLFVCVLIHEVAHSYVAKRNNIKINDITLYLFGGVSAMEEVPRNPSVELIMAAAGPLTSAAIGLICGVIYFALPMLRAGDTMGYAVGTTIFMLTYLNIMLGIFNILPAFPMDGGRVLRAFLAMRMQYMAATRIAAGIGKIFAIMLGLLGFMLGLSGIWFIIIAFFIYIAAGEEEQATVTSILLEGIKVKDIMTRAVDTMGVDASVSDLMRVMFEKKHLGYPVVENGRMVGIVALSDALKVPENQRDRIRVRDIMTGNVITLKPDDDASVALQKISQHRIGRLIVMDGDRIAGIVSRTDLVRALEIHGAMRGRKTTA